MIEKKSRKHRRSVEARERYLLRLTNPQWQELEKHYGSEAPEGLKKLYLDRELITNNDVVFGDTNGREWRVAEFLPADLETLETVWDDLKRPDIFPFASDPFGDVYYVVMSERDSPVMIYHHDGSDHELASGSIAEFVSSRARHK